MILMLLTTPAWAFESDPQEVVLEDFVELFQTAELDTGWVPKDGLLAVRFEVEARGGADVEMEGESRLYWPEDLNMTFDGVPGSGFIDMSSALNVIVTLKFDIDIYSWESQVANEGVSVRGTVEEFDPFAMTGGAPESVDFVAEGVSETLFEYTYDVLAGIASVGFYATLQPRSNVSFEGIAWLVEDQRADEAGEEVVLPAEGQPAIDTTATFISAWESDLDLVFTPTFRVCIAVLGCYDWDVTELGLDLAAERFEHAFPGVDLYFPLPVLDADDSAYDFGGVEVGNLSNLEVPLTNLGELPLEGLVSIEGSAEAFSVYPEYFMAGSASTDGVVVTFAPQDAGAIEATLVIQSNDPTQPDLRIPLRGEGLIDGVGADPDGNLTESSEVVKSGCGCASAPGDAQRRVPGVALLLAGVALLVGRRRR